MLKKVLKTMIRYATMIYFRKIVVVNKDKIPTKGPVIFTPNHPGAFMDPLLVASVIERNVYFITRGESFANKIMAKIFKHLQMIPIFRPEYSPDRVNENQFVFSQCHQVFSQGECIMIFPEGSSKTESRLRKIKTGAARMALSYENAEELTVIPVSINYINPHRFQTDVLIHINDPISLEEYLEKEKQESFSGVKELTNEIERSISSSLIIQENESFDDVEKEIKSLLVAHHLYKNKDANPIQLFDHVKKAMLFLSESDANPSTSKELRTSYEDFKHKKDSLKIRNRDLFLYDEKLSPSVMLGIVLGFIPGVIGYLAYVIPFQITVWLCNLLVKRADFRGAVLLVVGMFVFLFYEIGLIYTLNVLGVPWIEMLLVLLSLPFCGIFAYHFFRWVFSMIKTNRMRKKDYQKEDILELQRMVQRLFLVLGIN